MKILDGLSLSNGDREKIYYKNFEALTGAKLVK